ncbi:hypothetical protein TBR22_A00890 [Luteitalea sp. TBR-22]|uniref:sigma-54 interaction domain-containing protein n=1 Tax=Luteitalea sp. TBR-22 TaxID=2802971 RepID=UPI001AF3DC5F|nr:sigma-54 dependent transcriptional regulator [Luteitalea sp. TBR-22]BCS30888.1 hypothetical protein TBR22_A00890 [Luteitalea sp. TBR-22]
MDTTLDRADGATPIAPHGADRSAALVALPATGARAIVGSSDALCAVRTLIAQVAQTDSTVLLLGETGTGKERFAELIHQSSARRHRPMVRVNCAAIPATLIESELFGHERGAFTDALTRQIGRFEAAEGSTLFLDEIGDLPAEVQVKLLRVFEERAIERLGSAARIPVNVRIVAATHHDLQSRVAEGAFREDLFYRLNVFPVRVPPLRERPDDIPALVAHFVAEIAQALGRPTPTIAAATIEALQRHSWPGNVRELRNIVERAMVLSDGGRLVVPVPAARAHSGRRSERLVDVQRDHIRSVLDSVNWRIRGTGGAAEQLGLPPTTLETRMARLGLFRPKVP